MDTTQTLNAGVAIGLAQQTNLPLPAHATSIAAIPSVNKKPLVLGLLAVASCAAAVLWLKAALVVSEVLASIDAVYQSFCT